MVRVSTAIIKTRQSQQLFYYIACMKTSTILKFIFIVFVSVLNMPDASSQPDPVADFNKQIVQNWIGEYVRIGQYRVKGSPYLLGESFPGSITYKGGKSVTDKNILYDLYHQKAGVDVNHQIF